MLGDVCVHEATPVSTEASTDEETWVEGEPDEDEVKGASFDCFYMDPGANTQNMPRGRRKIDDPTILYEAEREDGSLVEVVAEDELLILAEEILGPTPVRFQVNGDPTPLAAPGELIGYECRLKRVID